MSRLLAWLREEIRLLGLDSWADGAYADSTEPHPCTSSDPRCAALIERQQNVRAAMRSQRVPQLLREHRMIDGKLTPVGAEKPYTRGADLQATFASIARVNVPPVRLIGRRAK